MFSASGVQTPCVGVSIGVERVFTVMEAKMRAAGAAEGSDVQVLVASVSKNMLPTKMAICRDLWAAGVAAEFSPQENPKMKPQLDRALERGIPFIVVVGDEEKRNGTAQVKNVATHTQEE